MTALVWDKTGERTYQTGIDRGVLFLPDGTVVPWNGLTSVEDNTSKETQAVYLDGLKYLEYLTPGDFSATLKAFTYPDEFDSVNGILNFTPGLRVHDQPARSFSLSYRTRLGDDLAGVDAGYLIHLIYNVLANPDSQESATISDSPSPSEFSWALSGRPSSDSVSWRPTAHISINSKELTTELLQSFEDVIYGTDTVNPRLPAISEVPTLLGFV